VDHDHRANNPNKGRAYLKQLRLEVSAHRR
jgi:hypothetical protein